MTLARRLAALEHAHSNPGEVARVLFVDDFLCADWAGDDCGIIGAASMDTTATVMRNEGETMARFRERAAQVLYPGVPGKALGMMAEAIYREQPPCD